MYYMYKQYGVLRQDFTKFDSQKCGPYSPPLLYFIFDPDIHLNITWSEWAFSQEYLVEWIIQ